MKGAGEFDQTIADAIVADIAETTIGLAKLCKKHHISTITLYAWLNDNKDFAKQYARGKEIQNDLIAEEIKDIADDTSNDTIETEKGEIPNNEWINRSRLRVDSRKWLLSKLQPKKYGDKLDVNHGGQADNPIITGMTVT